VTLHDPSILPTLHYIQDTLDDEVGWHNDLLTLQGIYDVDPQHYFWQELKWLRGNGINIRSSSAHGSSFCSSYHYLNYYFFRDFDLDTLPGYPNYITCNIDGMLVHFKKGTEPAFQLDNEAYHIPYDQYYSDVIHPDHSRWCVDDFNYDSLIPGQRVQILIHPYWWHNSYNYADFYQFRVNGQSLNSVIDPFTHYIKIHLLGNSGFNLIPQFVTGEEVEVYLDGVLQHSGNATVDFTQPVIYTLYNTLTYKSCQWTVQVINNNIVNVEKPSYHPVQISISPNPVNEILHISGLSSGKTSYISVTDLTGKSFIQKNFTSTRKLEEVSVSSLSAGVYFLKIDDGFGGQVFRFVKQ
jgi:hypothetical protein